jgi:hypothetical protein
MFKIRVRAILCGMTKIFVCALVTTTSAFPFLCYYNLWLRYVYGGLKSAMEWKDYACTLRITLASEQQQLVGECTAACAVCCGDAGSADLGERHPLPLNMELPSSTFSSHSALPNLSSHPSLPNLASDESIDLGLADGW